MDERNIAGIEPGTGNPTPENLTQLNSNTIDTNSGNKSAGTQRIVIATDQPNLTTPLNVTFSGTTATNVAQVSGTAASVSNGTTDAGTLRVTVASDSTGLIKLAAGTNIAGKFTTDQTTHGTSDLVASDVTKVGGTAIDTNSGNKSAGTQRTVIATDQPNLTTPLNVALAANQSVNVAQINGVTASMGNGTTDTGTIRATLSSDSTGQVKLATGANTIGALTANQSVNNAQISGTAMSVNNGTTDAGTTRVTLSSDSTGVVKLATGANTIGALSANQSTNIAQINGVTTSMGNGVTDTGTIRVLDNQAWLEPAALSAGSLNADLVASTDLQQYSTAVLQINTTAYSGTLTFAGSNDNTNFVSIPVSNNAQTGATTPITTTTATNIMYVIPILFRYLRIRMTSYASGTAQGTIEYKGNPTPLYVTPMSVTGGTVGSGSADSTNPVKIGGKYNATPVAFTDGNRTDLQMDINGFMRIGQAYSFTNISTQTTTTVKSGAGRVIRIIIPTPVATATVKIYDNTAASGTVLLDTITFPATPLGAPVSIELGCLFSTGLTIVTGVATMSLTAVYL